MSRPSYQLDAGLSIGATLLWSDRCLWLQGRDIADKPAEKYCW
jgi:hypothetical protein